MVRYESLTTEPLEVFGQMISFFIRLRRWIVNGLQRIIDEAVLEDVKPTGIEVIRKFGVRQSAATGGFQVLRSQALRSAGVSIVRRN